MSNNSLPNRQQPRRPATGAERQARYTKQGRQIGPCADVESIGEQWRCDACGVLLFPDECAEYMFQRAQEPVGVQWADVMRVLRATTGTAPDADDEGMCQASAADLRAWVADLRDRVGLDTNALNAAVESYINTVR